MSDFDNMLNAKDVFAQCAATGTGSLCAHFGIQAKNATIGNEPSQDAAATVTTLENTKLGL